MQVHWRKTYSKPFNPSQFLIFHLLTKFLTEYLLCNICLIGTGWGTYGDTWWSILLNLFKFIPISFQWWPIYVYYFNSRILSFKTSTPTEWNKSKSKSTQVRFADLFFSFLLAFLRFPFLPLFVIFKSLYFCKIPQVVFRGKLSKGNPRILVTKFLSSNSSRPWW